MRVIDRTRLTSMPFSLIILNGVHFPPQSMIQKLSQYAKEIIAADGAANHCLQWRIKPDIIIGDFDSVEDKVLKAFEGVKIIIDKDPNHSDFEKSILQCHNEIIMVISGLNGRLDQTFQNLHLMYKYADRFKISLMDELSLLTMIEKG